MRLRNRLLTSTALPAHSFPTFKSLIYWTFNEEGLLTFLLCTQIFVASKLSRWFTSTLQQAFITLTKITKFAVNNQTLYLHKYLLMTNNVWNDGFLFDFLQKKTIDAWVRRFVIYTGFVFSERLVFDMVYRVYIDFLLKPLQVNSIFETTNVAELLLITLFTYATLLLGVALLLI